jgi:cell division protein FtsQ
MKKSKIIIISIIAVLLIALGIIAAMLKITVAYTDKNGKITNSEELGVFTITFTGSDRYTSKELEEYFFSKKTDRNPFVFLFKSKFCDKIQIPFVETYDVEMLSLTDYKVTIYEKSVVGYINYMGSNMYFDKDGIVVESSGKILENVPLITGINFDYIILHQKLPVENQQIFTILLEITQLIEKYQINTDKIYISTDFEISLTLDKVTVELGKSEDLAEKVKELKDLIPSLINEKGVLDMKQYNYGNSGYTFKKDNPE